MSAMSKPTSGLDLGAIKARADAATPGLWFSNGGMHVDVAAPGQANDGRMVCRMPGYNENRACFNDATFIAHARADVPALLAEIERLTATNAMLWDNLAACSAHHANDHRDCDHTVNCDD